MIRPDDIGESKKWVITSDGQPYCAAFMKNNEECDCLYHKRGSQFQLVLWMDPEDTWRDRLNKMRTSRSSC